MATTNRDPAGHYIIPIQTGAGTVFRTKGGSGGTCNKPKKDDQGTFFVGAMDWLNAAQAKFLTALVLSDAQFSGGGGTTFTAFCEPGEEEE